MKISLPAFILIAVLSVPWCFAQRSDAEAPKDKQEAAATAREVKPADGTESLEEALDKKPGINFNSVQIGGQSSGISLSTIQADSVESLEALKLATPDMDADIVGGTLNLKFKPTFTQRRPTRQIRVYLTQYDLSDEIGKSFYLTEGRALGETFRWGYLLNARAYETFLAEENLNRDWQRRRNSDWPEIWRYQDVQIEKESFKTRSASANLLMDFELSPRLRLSVRGIAADTIRNEVNRHLEYEWDDGAFTSLDEDSAIVEGISLFKGIEDRRYERRTREITLGMDYRNDDWHWEGQFKYDAAKTEYPLRLDSFFKLENVDASYREARTKYPQFSFLNGSATKANDPGLFAFDEVREINSFDEYIDQIAGVDLERFIETEAGLLKIKSGLKLLQRDLDSRDDIQVFDEATGEINIQQFESDWSSGPIHGGKYELEGFHDHIAFREFFHANKDTFVLNETRTRSQTDPAIFTVNETVSSLYLMGDYVWDKWRVIAGVRGEKTEDEFTGKEVTFDENGDYDQTIDTEGGRSYSNLFPGVQAVFQASDRLILYTSVSRALERPRYFYLAPFRRIIQRSQNIRAGNPNLKATEFTSFLAAADWAYADSGFLSLELLRRDNENIVVESRRILTEGQFADFELYTWENAAKGLQNQMEFVWNQDLDPVLAELEGFSLEMRYRLNDTETDVRGPDSEPLPIAGVADKDIRASIIYRNKNWLVRLRADHESDVLRRVGSDIDTDFYNLGNTTYDFSVEYRAGAGWVGNVGMYNFDGDDRETYFGVRNRPADLASRGRYWRGSVRYTF